MEAKAFRFQYDESARLLGIPVTIEYVDSKSFIQRKELTALIDTGSSTCCIDKNLAKSLDFTTLGTVKTGTAAGIIPSNIHTVNIVLPEGIRFDNEELLEVDTGIDFIIGLNLLKKGDFMLSHYDGSLIFSFKIPPVNTGFTYKIGNSDISLGKSI